MCRYLYQTIRTIVLLLVGQSNIQLYYFINTDKTTLIDFYKIVLFQSSDYEMSLYYLSAASEKLQNLKKRLLIL